MRLHIIAEGQTEETFVNEILAFHLAENNIATDVRCVMTSRHRAQIYRGGLLSYRNARFDVMQWAKQDHSEDVRFTTMFDYYALPPDFPGYAEAQKSPDPYQKVQMIEAAFQEDISDPRFIPYIQLHEFEALLFADIQHMQHAFVENERGIKDLIKISYPDNNPELIDESRMTAPSKRIIQAIPEYEDRKASAGPLVAKQIGMATMREKCRHFDAWITQLEQLND